MANCIRCGRQLPPLSWKKICQWCVQHEAAQRDPDDSDARQSVMPTPWVRQRESTITLTHVLFGANIAIFLAMVAATIVATGAPSLDFPFSVSVHFGANYGPDTLAGQWWRLVTYMFLHGGPMHIFFNMWCLWDLGRLCESLYGRWTYAGIYLITGVSGGLASVGWNPHVWSVGASGAIFGLAGALIASFYLGEFSLPSISIRGTLRSLVVFAGFNLVIGQVIGGIDNACHIGGLLSGLALGAVIARLAPQADAPMRRASVIGVVALAVLAAGFGVRQWRGGQARLAREYEALEGKGDDIGKLQLIAKQQPNSIPVRFALADAYFNHQQFPQAEVEYKRVLELNPKYGPAKFDLGLVYLNEKRHDDARAAFSDLLAQESTSAEGHYGLGLVLADQGKHQAAIDEFKAALQKDPSHSDINYELGNSYSKLQMWDEAIAAYSQERETGGDNPDIETALANAYAAKGMTQQAQDARARADQLKSGH